MVSIATGLDGSLDEDSPERLTIREVYDSVSAGLKAKQDALAPKALTDLTMLKLYAQALLKEGPYRKAKIRASEEVAETFHKTSMELGLKGGFAVCFSIIRSIGLSLWRLVG